MRLPIRSRIGFTACIVWALCAGVSAAQSRGNTGQSSGGSLFPSSSSGGGQSSFGGSSASGGLGGQGFGGGGGAGGAGGPGGQGAGGFGGAATINNQNQGFVGRNADVAAFIGAVEQGRANGGGGNGGSRSFGGGGNRGLDQSLLSGQNAQTGQQPVIRPRLKANFTFPAPNLDQTVAATRVRFEKLGDRHPQLASVNIALKDEGLVVLTGEVGSVDAAKLAASLLRLEPGVRKVQNDLRYPLPAPTE